MSPERYPYTVELPRSMTCGAPEHDPPPVDDEADGGELPTAVPMSAAPGARQHPQCHKSAHAQE